jgi:predicted nucleotidyltransferase
MSDVKEIIAQFKARLATIYGARLKLVILYGSHARNEARPDSDIDLAVVLTGEVTPGREIDRMLDAITDVNLEHSALLSVYPVSERDYEGLRSPLMINLRREGVRA